MLKLIMDKATLDRHLAYTSWATNHLLRAVASLPPEHLTHDFKTGDRTITNTLAHIFGADRIWLDRLLGRHRSVLIEDRDRDLALLNEEWPKLLNAWREWLGAFDEAHLNEPISYRDMAGNPHQSLPGEIVFHVVNHGTHHRGQVSGFLRALGYTPPPIDLIRFYRGL